MNFIIHIGTHKTGSTALQSFLFKNKESLLSKGILYPTQGMKDNAHHPIAWAIRSGDTEKFVKILHGIKKEATAVNAHTVILSSEEFEFIRNKNALKPIFSLNPRIIFFFRRQDTYFESAYNQHVKMYSLRYSHDIYHFYFHRDFTQHFNYRFLCDVWEPNPNARSVEVINFDHYFTDTIGIFKAFLSRLGIDWNNDFIIPETQESNISIPAAATIYLARINRLNLSIAQHQAAIQLITREFRESPKRQLLSHKDRLILWNRFNATNNYVVNHYGLEPFTKPEENPQTPTSVIDFYHDFDEGLFNKMTNEIIGLSETQVNKIELVAKNILDDKKTMIKIKKYVIGFPDSRRVRLFFERNQLLGEVVLIEAVNGKSLPASIVKELFSPSFYNHQLKHKNFSWLQGTLGCLLSHIKAIEQAQGDSVDYALICEDDACFRQSPDAIFNICQQHNYDIVYINDRMTPRGQRQFTGQYAVNPLIAENHNGTGACAYILSRQAMSILLELFTSNLKKGLPAGYDCLLQSTILKKGELIDKPGLRNLGLWHNSLGTNLSVGISSPTIVSHDDEGISLIRGHAEKNSSKAKNIP